MRNTILIALTVMFAILLFFPLASSAQIVIGKEPGTEIPEVTPGPGWKTCPRCQNNGHMPADHHFAEVFHFSGNAVIRPLTRGSSSKSASMFAIS
jgi:hypothetical protein